MKRGWLETWYVEDGYLALGRFGAGVAEAGCGAIAGLVVLDKEPVFRVRYGFIEPGEARIRIRGHKRYKGGEEVRIRLAVVCGKDLGWKWARYIREAWLHPPLIAFAGEPWRFPPVQKSPPFLMPY